MIYWMRCLIANKWSRMRKDTLKYKQRAWDGVRDGLKNKAVFLRTSSIYMINILLCLHALVVIACMEMFWNENSGLNNLHKYLNLRTNFDFSAFGRCCVKEKYASCIELTESTQTKIAWKCIFKRLSRYRQCIEEINTISVEVHKT